MRKFTRHTGRAVAIDQPNIDTDQIIPKQFLKRIERTGYGEFLFYDRRFAADGTPRPEFVLNQARYKDASVLLAGANFGCGSSREHAPWSLSDYGFRVIVAPSFADIFYSNSLKTGLLPVVLSEAQIGRLIERSQNREAYEISVDLENRTVSDTEGFRADFEIEEFRRYCLLNGLDDIDLTLQREAQIRDYEDRLKSSRPFLAF